MKGTSSLLVQRTCKGFSNLETRLQVFLRHSWFNDPARDSVTLKRDCKCSFVTLGSMTLQGIQ